MHLSNLVETKFATISAAVRMEKLHKLVLIFSIECQWALAIKGGRDFLICMRGSKAHRIASVRQ